MPRREDARLLVWQIERKLIEDAVTRGGERLRIAAAETEIGTLRQRGEFRLRIAHAAGGVDADAALARDLETIRRDGLDLRRGRTANRRPFAGVAPRAFWLRWGPSPKPIRQEHIRTTIC
jgi:hypothetical protein